MSKWYVGWKIRTLLLGAFALLSTGCFKNPGQEVAPNGIALPVTPVYVGINTSYLRASGNCQGNGGFIITYSSSLTPSNTSEANCSEGVITMNLPVQQGMQNQIFNVDIVSKLKGRKSKPVSIVVNYAPPFAAPGFAILSGGVFSTGGGVDVAPAIGQPYGPVRTTAGAVNADLGIKGVLEF
ncbi:MAG: hypothetical protein IT289_02215 [Oligoflexia bacterium]|nr:hypothetical protein [Oligoflexia bacterium]